MFHGPKPWNEWRTLMGVQRVWDLCIFTLGQSNIDVEKSTFLIVHPFLFAAFHIYMSYPTFFFFFLTPYSSSLWMTIPEHLGLIQSETQILGGIYECSSPKITIILTFTWP